MKQAVLILLMFAPLGVLAAELSDGEVRSRVVAESIATYAGNCPCPFSENAAGRRCGDNSAWSKRGGAVPLCYPDDVTDDRVRAWRERNGP